MTRAAAILLLGVMVATACGGRGRDAAASPTLSATPVAPVATAAASAPPQGAPASPAPSLGAVASASRMGVNMGAKQLDPRAARAVAVAADLGPVWFRMGCGWAWSEPRPGKYDWRLCDEQVRAVRAAGSTVLFMTGQANHVWNTTAPPEVTDPARREQYPPSDWAAYERYVGELVRHYRGIVTHWEVGNEPDLKGYWAGTAAEYARLLSTTYDAVKRADPAASVVFGGLSLGGTPGALDLAFFEKVLDDQEYPGRAKFDIANFHHYGGAAEARRRYEYVRGEMRERGIDRPIWVTEVGTSSSAGGSTPEKQAAYLREAGAYLFSLGAQRVFWYELMDGRQRRDGTFEAERAFVGYGLLDRELAKKPAFEAFRQAARQR